MEITSIVITLYILIHLELYFFIEVVVYASLLYPTRPTVQTIAGSLSGLALDPTLISPRVASGRLRGQLYSNVSRCDEKEQVSVDVTKRKSTHHSKSVPTNRRAKKSTKARKRKIA